MKAGCDGAVLLWVCSKPNRLANYWRFAFLGVQQFQIDKEFGTRVVRKFEPKNGSKFATPANDRNKMDIA